MTVKGVWSIWDREIHIYVVDTWTEANSLLFHAYLY